MRMVTIGRVRRLRGNRHDRSPQFGVRRQHPMKTDQVQARARHEGGEPLHEFQRRHHDVARAIAIGCFQREHHLPRGVHTQPFVCDDRASLTPLLLCCITNYLVWYRCAQPIYAESVCRERVAATQALH